MAVLNVRRLAAVDMWGTAGKQRRRRLIRAEFVVGAVGCTGLGLFVLISAGSTLWLLVGCWLVGIGINYVPLALHATALSRPGELEDELSGLDVPRELRRVGLQQFWIAVPLVVAGAAVVQSRDSH